MSREDAMRVRRATLWVIGLWLATGPALAIRPALAVEPALATKAAPAGGPARHVALISVDGLRPADYLGGGPCGPAPRHLAAIMRMGVYAQGVAGVLPTLTYPSHATLVTGVRPNHHGVLANARARDGAAWHFDRSDIHAPTLWDAARGAGLSVAIVTWPSTYGADATYLVPEDLSSDADVAARLQAGSTPGLFQALEAAAGPARLLPFSDPEACVPLDRMTAAFASEIVRRHKPDLLLLHFLDLDHRQHDAGPGSDAACRSLARIDDLIGQVRDAYREADLLDRTTFVVVSDHGFVPVHTLVNIPALLARAGWANVDPGRGTFASDLEVRVAEGSAAFYPNAHHPKQRNDRALIARAEKDLRPRIEPRYQGLVRWVTRDEARRQGGFDGAAFVLCASPGYFFTVAPASAEVLLESATRRGTHGYCPDEPGMDAAFIAGGTGIRPLGAVPRLRMIDVAPTIAALLRVTLPDAEGLTIAGILEPDGAR
jgi:predicted AlkP superfamily pyrophosphatase or phosphodiesterase